MHQVLARKYRPKSFDELVGQEHVARALMGSLEADRMHHAYLFTGTRGVGKTTIARLLAKCLNCETGVSAKPCQVCSTCRAIDQGSYTDLIEIDAASRTKVEDTRELLDKVSYAAQGRYKVYLIDEVHMLSTHSFNALLKTLEEPPSHVKFLLATTDPQKLPITIISRCLQFVLRPLAQKQIVDHLSEVLTQESVGFDEAALWGLAAAAQGSVRDSLSLTDQAIAYSGGQITEASIKDMLGLLSPVDTLRMLEAIHAQQKQTFAALITQLREQLIDAHAVLEQLIELIFELSLMQELPDLVPSLSVDQFEAMQRVAKLIDPADLQLYYQIALQGSSEMKMSSSPQQALEMTLLRMLSFRPLEVPNAPSSPSMDTAESLEAQEAVKKT